MAMRAIVKKNQDILRKKCKTVEVFDGKLATLLDDMKETMNASDGVGLAAPQVGVLKRVFIMDIGEGLIEAINPELSNFSGEQRDVEGCLSFPEEFGYVTRPLNCTLTAQNRHGEPFSIDLTALGARCAFHENDHLNGKLFVDLVEEMIDPNELEKLRK